MNLLIALLVGAGIGWAIAVMSERDGEMRVLSAVIGVVGSVAAGALFTLLSSGQEVVRLFSWTSLVWSIIGALATSLLFALVPHQTIE